MWNGNGKTWDGCGIWILVGHNKQGGEYSPLGSMILLLKLFVPKLLYYSCYACPAYCLSSQNLGQPYRWICEFVGILDLNFNNLFFLYLSAQLVSSFHCFLWVPWAGFVSCYINISSLLWWVLLWGRGASLALIISNFLFLQPASKGLGWLLSVV